MGQSAPVGLCNRLRCGQRGGKAAILNGRALFRSAIGDVPMDACAWMRDQIATEVETGWTESVRCHVQVAAFPGQAMRELQDGCRQVAVDSAHLFRRISRGWAWFVKISFAE